MTKSINEIRSPWGKCSSRPFTVRIPADKYTRVVSRFPSEKKKKKEEACTNISPLPSIYPNCVWLGPVMSPANSCPTSHIANSTSRKRHYNFSFFAAWICTFCPINPSVWHMERTINVSAVRILRYALSPFRPIGIK